jgi:PIN domain nuclease of toxin-antitoxin system
LSTLLDTDVFLWLHIHPERLKQDLIDRLTDPGNAVFLSPITPWEILIKTQRGKLTLDYDLAALIAQSRFRELPIRLDHAISAANLPPHHADPFDRMLVAQAKTEKLTLLTSNEQLAAYGDFVQLV